MNTHALAVLEFGRVLAAVAGRATSADGAERVRALAPRSDRELIEREQTRVYAMRALVAATPPWDPPPIPAARSVLARLRVAGSSLQAAELVVLRDVLRAARVGRDTLEDGRRPQAATAALASDVGRLLRDPRAEAAVDRVIGSDGEVRDDASPRLRATRRELRGAQGALVALLDRIMGSLDTSVQVPDMSVTVRNGRYVIPVRREGRAAVGGIVHDTSATGGTLFIEPPAAIEVGNRMRELEAEEREEVERLLAELTDALRPSHDALAAAYDALVELDSLYARARFAVAYDAPPVAPAEPDAAFRIVGGRHPLLLVQGTPVVPFDLAMDAGERTLLVSGPNTGGKTVLLKGVALLSLMLQAGVPPTVGEGSTIPVYEEMFADIGDEQSIAASLSTFSAHVRNLREIMDGATNRSLVLVDELGSGTDPVEGAALGGAVLDALTARGARTIATTHLGALKQLAIENPGVVNASLQFDPVALAPSYRLVKGIPGQSFGLSIARRLGIPEEVLRDAETRLPRGERDANALLADLEAREVALAEREREAATIAEDARERARRVAERERNAGLRERDAERRARQEARRYLLAARREIEGTIRAIRDAGAASGDVAGAAREARRRVEELAAEQAAALDQLDVRDRGALPGARRPTEERLVGVGDYVEVETLGWRTGQIAELRDDDAVVTVGTVRVTAPRRALRRVEAPAREHVTVPVRGDMPEIHAPSEIDVRGLRADEVEGIVMHAVDEAVRADLRALRIIHGKGTGALRDRVSEMLRKEPRVANFRLGGWNEGGAGVTVVELA